MPHALAGDFTGTILNRVDLIFGFPFVLDGHSLSKLNGLV